LDDEPDTARVARLPRLGLAQRQVPPPERLRLRPADRPERVDHPTVIAGEIDRGARDAHERDGVLRRQAADEPRGRLEERLLVPRPDALAVHHEDDDPAGARAGVDGEAASPPPR